MDVRNKLTKYLSNVYGDGAKHILDELDKQKIFLEKEPSLDNCENPNWYKDIILYAVYPDGVCYNSRLSPFKNLALHLDKIKALGCNAIHILPFLSSPMQDAGFDVSNYYTIRKGLGTIQELKALVKKARSLNLAIFMDAVFNHVSSEHEWFQKAKAGEVKYQDYFAHTDIEPQFIEKYFRNSAIWAKYNVNGHHRNVSIVFPEHAGPIPHWHKCDNKWYYHTFYADQPDVNWFNPEVFSEYAKIIIYWAKLGFNFRLDALQYIGQHPYKKTDLLNHNADYIFASLKLIATQVNNGCLFLSESNERPKKLISYFGQAASQQADLSYQFHTCTYIWTSLATHDNRFIWQSLHLYKNIPKHAKWLYFLRNHDELSLDHLSNVNLNIVRKKFAKFGKDFRENCGISGRSFSLLDKDKEAFIMAYFIVSILPGGIMLPYGDEIAKPNEAVSKLSYALRKDTRNINRGKILKNDYKTPIAKFAFNHLHRIFKIRARFAKYFHNFPEKLTTYPNILGFKYSINDYESISIFVNLSKKARYINIPTNSRIEFIVNHVEIRDNKIKLGDYAGVFFSCNSKIS